MSRWPGGRHECRRDCDPERLPVAVMELRARTLILQRGVEARAGTDLAHGCHCLVACLRTGIWQTELGSLLVNLQIAAV